MKSRRRIRIGLLVPSSNTIMETDLHRALADDRYTIHTDRMFLVETTRAAEIIMIEKHAPLAAKDLSTIHPDLLVFGCTSGGSLFGPDYDARLCRDLGEIAGCPALGVITAVSDALTAANGRHIAVITPQYRRARPGRLHPLSKAMTATSSPPTAWASAPTSKSPRWSRSRSCGLRPKGFAA